MSMIGNYYMTDEETIKKIKAGDLSVEELIYDENDDMDEEAFLDIDKTWHAIHFTLTGEIDEGEGDNILSKAVLGGNLINDEDIGYGPAMLITADEVVAINEIIKNISQAEFKAKFSVKDMDENDIYPVFMIKVYILSPVKDMGENDIYPVSEDVDEDEFFEYVWSYFESLKVFYQKAANEKKCLLFYIS